MDTIKKWEEEHPNWNDSLDGKNMYIEMVNNITSSCQEQDTNKIIKTIAKEVIIEKNKIDKIDK